MHNGKRKYYTEADAVAVAVDMSSRHGGEFMAYLCYYCECYHVGHPPVKRRREVEALSEGRIKPKKAI